MKHPKMPSCPSPENPNRNSPQRGGFELRATMALPARLNDQHHRGATSHLHATSDLVASDNRHTQLRPKVQCLAVSLAMGYFQICLEVVLHLAVTYFHYQALR